MSQDTGLFFGQFPKNFDSLRAVLVSVQDGHGRTSEHFSEVHQFYREIIFTEPDLLIAPEYEEYLSSNNAIIIAEAYILQSPRLLNTLEKFYLEKTKDIPVTRNLLLYCFEFVVSHRLAPFWNKIGSYYIKGRDFLLDKEKICAITANFSLTDKIIVGLNSLMIKLPPPKIEDFGVSPNILQTFRQSNDVLINGHSLENTACLVLPSLKTGYITRIAHKTSNDFDFKKYWKVMYGFRLPSSSKEEDFLYSIRFPASDKIFLYPEYCIRSKEPQVFLRCDQKAMFSSFMEDLLSRLPSLCGSPLKFTSSTLHPTTTFYSASLSKQTNLTRSFTPSKSTLPFVLTAKNVSPNEPAKEISKQTSKQSSTIETAKEISTKETSKQTSTKETAKEICAKETSEEISANETTKNTVAKETFEKTAKITSPQYSCQEKTSCVSVRQGAKKPYIPCFPKRKSSGKGLKTIPTMNNQCDKVVRPPTVPCFKKKSISGSSMKKAEGNKRSASSTRKTVHCTTKNKCTSRVPSDKENLLVTNNECEITEHATENRVSIHQQNKDNYVTVGSNQAELQKSSGHVFRETGCFTPDSKRKRTEKQPKADVNHDIRKLAMEHKLSKVNAITISTWLKTEGVKTKSHEKKAELIRKVYEFLELGQPEP